MDSRVLPAHVRAQAARRARLTLGGLLCALQVRAIETEVDPNLVRDRIAALKTERAQIDADLAALQPTQPNGSINLDEASEILSALPDLGKAPSSTRVREDRL